MDMRRFYLVVDHHVYGAVSGVGRQVGQVESLVHDSLTCERSVAVKEDGHHLRTVGRVREVRR